VRGPFRSADCPHRQSGSRACGARDRILLEEGAEWPWGFSAGADFRSNVATEDLHSRGSKLQHLVNGFFSAGEHVADSQTCGDVCSAPQSRPEQDWRRSTRPAGRLEPRLPRAEQRWWSLQAPSARPATTKRIGTGGRGRRNPAKRRAVGAVVECWNMQPVSMRGCLGVPRQAFRPSTKEGPLGFRSHEVQTELVAEVLQLCGRDYRLRTVISDEGRSGCVFHRAAGWGAQGGGGKRSLQSLGPAASGPVASRSRACAAATQSGPSSFAHEAQGFSERAGL